MAALPAEVSLPEHRLLQPQAQLGAAGKAMFRQRPSRSARTYAQAANRALEGGAGDDIMTHRILYKDIPIAHIVAD